MNQRDKSPFLACTSLDNHWVPENCTAKIKKSKNSPPFTPVYSNIYVYTNIHIYMWMPHIYGDILPCEIAWGTVEVIYFAVPPVYGAKLRWFEVSHTTKLGKLPQRQLNLYLNRW